ncbi:hypothetical protein [Ferrimonas sp. SCSIO 43195]|uniref:hypothetical protein n=1 Tax=Ferrimonas sp. SCSIO 43195 TaxID=2822844 RepID=UPI002074BB2C|nr:hypothetical protein [Ferrimonas sp. SCSIO 43195]USD39477.1 hypothetical protein J8Z22_10480 [Ferrimonas sp. SCSIO 43195]
MAVEVQVGKETVFAKMGVWIKERGMEIGEIGTNFRNLYTNPDYEVDTLTSLTNFSEVTDG